MRNGLPAGHATGLTFELLGSAGEISRFAPEWSALAEAAARPASPFQRPEWAIACARLMESGRMPGRPAVAVIRRAGRTVLVAPLAMHGGYGFERAEWIGGRLAIFGDVILAGETDAGVLAVRLFQELRKRFAWCVLEGVRADSALASALGPIRMQACDSSPAIDLSGFGSPEAFEAARSRSTRKGWLRKERKLAGAGAIGFAFEPGDRDPARVSRLFAMKREWALANGVLSRSINDPAFEELVAALAATHPGARMSVLTSGDRTIAMELGFVEGGRYFSYLCAYDTSLGHLSPGALQMRRTIAACIAAGLDWVDLMPPADAYKMQWATTSTPTFSLRLSRRRSPLAAALALAQRADLPRMVAAAVPSQLRPAAARALAVAAKHRAGARDLLRVWADFAASRPDGAMRYRGLVGAAAAAGAVAWALAAE